MGHLLLWLRQRCQQISCSFTGVFGFVSQVAGIKILPANTERNAEAMLPSLLVIWPIGPDNSTSCILCDPEQLLNALITVISVFRHYRFFNLQSVKAKQTANSRAKARHEAAEKAAGLGGVLGSDEDDSDAEELGSEEIDDAEIDAALQVCRKLLCPSATSFDCCLASELFSCIQTPYCPWTGGYWKRTLGIWHEAGFWGFVAVTTHGWATALLQGLFGLVCGRSYADPV